MSKLKVGDNVFYKGDEGIVREVMIDGKENFYRVDVSKKSIHYLYEDELDLATQKLNDNQKIVLKWLKDPLNDIPNRFAKDYFAYITCLFLGQAPERVIKSYRELSSEQQMQILSVWGLEQQGNSDGIN